MPKLYLFHGAGAGHQSVFLKLFKQRFEQCTGLEIQPITLSYMQQIEQTGKKRPPPAINKLVAEAQGLIDPLEPVVLLGKSMGCRIAAELCVSHNVKAVVALGYPFYPAKKPEKHRLGQLALSVNVPYLITQGARDSLGAHEWVMQQTLPNNVDLKWVEGADHDFNVLKRYNRLPEETVDELVHMASGFIQLHLSS